jgi:hypothetical protein
VQWLTSVIPATQEAEIKFKASPGKKLSRPSQQQQKADVVTCAYNPRYMRSRGRRTADQDQPRQKL